MKAKPSQFLRNKITIAQNIYHTNKKRGAVKEESFGAKQAKFRPANYDQLSEGEKWDIDKALGILDWGGE